MWGKGYLIGMGVAFLLWLIVRSIDKKYDKKKLALIQKKLEERESGREPSQDDS